MTTGIDAATLTQRLQWTEVAVLVGLLALLSLLESLPALRARGITGGRAAHAWRNAALWLIGLTIIAVPLAGMLVSFTLWLEARGVGLFYGLGWPWWATLACGVVLVDAADYLFHRLSHDARWLWRLHAVHHSDRMLDVTTNVRAHPLHVVLTVGWRLLVLAALGLPQWIAIVRDLLALPVAMVAHANLRCPARIDRALRALLVTPAVHRIHHSTEAHETNSNFGSLLSCWDRWCGTYVEPMPGHPQAYGLDSVPADQANRLGAILRSPWRGALPRSADGADPSMPRVP